VTTDHDKRGEALYVKPLSYCFCMHQARMRKQARAQTSTCADSSLSPAVTCAGTRSVLHMHQAES